VIRTLAFAGYRSLRELRLEVGQLTVITGGNGAGKSNVYRALRLLVDAAEGQLGRAMAREGGMPSAMWGGEPAKAAKSSEGKRLSIGFADDQMAYELRLGLAPPQPEPVRNAFHLDLASALQTIV
jgi:predicted ATPase